MSALTKHVCAREGALRDTNMDQRVMRRTTSFYAMTCRTAWLVAVIVCGALVFLQVCDLSDRWWIHVGFPKTVYLWIFSDSRLPSEPSLHAIVVNVIFAFALVASGVHVSRKLSVPVIRLRLPTLLALLLAVASYPWISDQVVNSLWDLLVCVSTTIAIVAVCATWYTGLKWLEWHCDCAHVSQRR